VPPSEIPPSLTYWINSSESAALLPGEHVTVMVMTPAARRHEQLRLWTAQELRLQGFFDQRADMFALTSASPVELTPEDFFTGRHWLKGR